MHRCVDGVTSLPHAVDSAEQRTCIVEAGERLGVNYRTAAKCLDERHVSRRMRQALKQYLREQTEHEDQATAPVSDKPEGGEEARLQEPEQELRRQVEALGAEVESLRKRVEAVEGRVSQGWGGGGDGVNAEGLGGVDADGDSEGQRSVVPPRRVFPELITEQAERGEEQVYGAAAGLVVEWREAWVERKSARYTLDWLRAERRRLELELRLIGVFGLTPPPADAPWGERRRERELEWRRRALRRLRWQLPLTWLLHWLLRVLALGLWGRNLGTIRRDGTGER